MEERPYWTTEAPEVEAPDTEPPLPTRGRPRVPLWRRPVVLAATAAAVLAGGGIAVGMSLDSRGSASTSSQVHVWGSITITGLNSIDTQNPTNSLDGDACEAATGYDDITAGAAVVIGGPTGQVGIGALGTGVIDAGRCTFSFDVPAPSGLSVYTVTISHRGTQTFTPDELAGGVRLSLGN